MSKKKYTLEFKQEAVKLILEEGYSQSEVSKRLDVPPVNLNRWVRSYRVNTKLEATPHKKIPSVEQQELEQLRKENKRLKLEREILKKAAAFFANESN